MWPFGPKRLSQESLSRAADIFSKGIISRKEEIYEAMKTHKLTHNVDNTIKLISILLVLQDKALMVYLNPKYRRDLMNLTVTNVLDILHIDMREKVIDCYNSYQTKYGILARFVPDEKEILERNDLSGSFIKELLLENNIYNDNSFIAMYKVFVGQFERMTRTVLGFRMMFM